MSRSTSAAVRITYLVPNLEFRVGTWDMYVSHVNAVNFQLTEYESKGWLRQEIKGDKLNAGKLL